MYLVIDEAMKNEAVEELDRFSSTSADLFYDGSIFLEESDAVNAAKEYAERWKNNYLVISLVEMFLVELPPPTEVSVTDLRAPQPEL